ADRGGVQGDERPRARVGRPVRRGRTQYAGAAARQAVRRLTIKTLTTSLSPTIAPPEPELTPAELLARAEALRPALRERQAATEATGRLLDETHAAFVEAGFYRTLQPRRFGGYEFPLRDFVRVMSAVSRGCPSSGWVLALTAGHPHLLGHFSER